MQHRVIVVAAVLFGIIVLAGCNDSSSSGGTNVSPSTPVTQPPVSSERLWRDAGFGLVAHDEVVNGVFIATDYAYDDRGPNTDETAGGDSTYPADGEPYFKNAADLIEVRGMPVDTEQKLLLGVRFNTLVDPKVPVAAIGIADGSSASLNKPWPFSPGVSATGVRYVVTLRHDTATVTDLISGEAEDYPAIAYNDQAGDARNLENTFTAVIPYSAFGIKDDPLGTLGLHAVSGLWGGEQWAEAPFDAAFLQDTFVNWQQNEQADLLRAGDLGSAKAELKASDFPQRPVSLKPGRYTRVYPSRISETVGEGIVPWAQRAEGVEAPTLNHYRGLYLPYTLWVPEEITSPERLPLFIYLHGASQNHLSHLQPWVDGIVDAPAIVIAPTGAGELSFYKEEGEVDVLASMEDVIQHYPIDRDQVFLSGLSMGGQGTFSVATHRPDLFAAAVPFIGTGQGTFNEDVPGNTEIIPSNRWMSSTGRPLLENALNLPFRLANGALDPIVNISWPTQDVARMKELESDHQFLVFHGRHHETIPEYINAVYHQLIDGCDSASVETGCVADRDVSGVRRDVNPARVRYKVIPYHFVDRISLRYEGAYWVSGMTVRETPNDVSFGVVDATSLALAGKLNETLVELGPDPVLVFDPTGDNYSFQGLRRAPSPAAKENRLNAQLTNLSTISFDLQRAGIAPLSESAVVAINSDGPTRLTLSGLLDSVAVSIDGSPVGSPQGGELVVDVGGGRTEINLSP